MARPRKLWSALQPATRDRKLKFYRKLGLSDNQIKSRYNAGSLGSQKAVRGHAKTPEKPSEAARHPERYQDYLQKKQKGRGGPPINFTPRQRAHYNIWSKLGEYVKYDDKAVKRRVFEMMTDAEVEWTISASEDMLLGRAAAAWGIRFFNTFTQSPWWYHKD